MSLSLTDFIQKLIGDFQQATLYEILPKLHSQIHIAEFLNQLQLIYHNARNVHLLSTQSVGNICLARVIEQFKVVVLQVLHPPALPHI